MTEKTLSASACSKNHESSKSSEKRETGSVFHMLWMRYSEAQTLRYPRSQGYEETLCKYVSLMAFQCS